MSVKAKLYVSEITRQASCPDQVQVKLAAVTRGDANKQWSEATPSASFSMSINNPEAGAMFVLGQEFYVTFDLAEPVSSLADGVAFEARGEGQWERGYCRHCQCRERSHAEPLRSQLLASVRF